MRTLSCLLVIFSMTHHLSGQIRDLSDFGSLDSPKQIQQSFTSAVIALSTSGGVLHIPNKAAKHLNIENTTQHVKRIPDTPQPTRTWFDEAGITILESDRKHLKVHVPQLKGIHLSRVIRMKEKESFSHWGRNPMIYMDNRVIHGPNSYMDYLLFDVPKGEDRKFYVPTERGLRPGQFLNLHGGPGYRRGVNRAYVKSVGYDEEKKLHYFVADTKLDHKAGAILHNKNNVGFMNLNQYAHSDEQTYDVSINRYQYGHGDTYMYYGHFNYNSNIHSAAGDESGVIYGGFSASVRRIFRARVKSVNWNDNKLSYEADGNADTLGNSRPLINLNPKKWITSGKLRIVPPESHYDLSDTGKYPYKGTTYPTRIVKRKYGRPIPMLKVGGLMRGDVDCPWDQSIVGRFIAVDEDDEIVPFPGKARTRRWYKILSLKVNDDGSKDISIQFFWWGAKSANSVKLYNYDNYTWDGHDRPLKYIIAPGCYVNDISKAVSTPDRSVRDKVLGMNRYSDMNTEHDFEPGDLVEQAVGSDPRKPIIFRNYNFDAIPGVYPSPIFDITNNGDVARDTVLSIGGGSQIKEKNEQGNQKPAWDNIITVNRSVTNGIVFRGDVIDTAIHFKQPNRDSIIKWNYGPVTSGKVTAESTLKVDHDSGEFHLDGKGVHTHGPISRTTGISSTTVPARNLRGINVAVAKGSNELKVHFDVAEADSSYAVFVEQTWFGNRIITDKSTQGFTIRFERAAPDQAHLDWMILR